MYETLQAKHADGSNMPMWAKETPYAKLLILQRILENRLYDPLTFSFNQDTTEGDRYIPIADRRPMVRFNMARMTALKVARKMFAGRQRPSFKSKGGTAATAADLLAREGLFYAHMQRAAFYGSVGASCVTFSYRPDGAGDLRIIFNAHKAFECQPVFDPLGELISLRLNRTTTGAALREIGRTIATDGPVRAGGKYWHVCQYDAQRYSDFIPIPYEDYKPTEPSTWDKLVEDANHSTTHGLGFVPAHWMADLTLGPLPWGGCYWEELVSNMIANDYTLSQGVRGLWYSAAPQTVIQGELKNQEEDGKIHHGPANVLQFDVTKQGAANERVEGGDAHLLEASGAGFTENREMAETLRKFSLESVQTSRKDPDRMRTAGMSGAAMENMDEDFVDLMMGQKDIYCEGGALVAMKKALRAGVKQKHPACVGLTEAEIGSLGYQHPQPYPPGSHEVLEYAQAFRVALGQPETPAGPAGPDGKPGKPGTPAEEPFLEPEDAANLFKQLLNIPSVEPEPSSQQAPLVDEPAVTGGTK